MENYVIKLRKTNMNLAALIISFLSLVQGIKNKRSQEEKIEDLKKALETLDDIYALLSLAKTVHDNFEHFSSAAMEPLLISIKDEKLSLSETHTHFEDFFSRATLFLTDYILLEWQESTLVSNASLPVEIQNKIKNIDAIYPEFCRNLDEFDHAMKALHDFHNDQNYGKPLKENVSLASHNLKNTMAKADRIILLTAHLLDFVHFQLKDGVGSI